MSAWRMLINVINMPFVPIRKGDINALVSLVIKEMVFSVPVSLI